MGIRMPGLRRGPPVVGEPADSIRRAVKSKSPVRRFGVRLALILTVLALAALLPLRWLSQARDHGGPLVAAALWRIEAATGARIDLGVVAVDWTAGTFSAGPVVVTGNDGASILTARAVHFTLAATRLWERRIVLDAVRLVEPSVALRIVDGAVAGLTLSKGTRTAPGFTVEVRSLVLQNGAVHLEFHDGPALAGSAGRDPVWQRGIGLTLRGIDGTVVGSGSHEHALAVSIADVGVHGVEGFTRLDPISAELWVAGGGLLAPERIAFTEVHLVSEDIEVAVSGMVDLRGAGTASAAADPFAVDVDITGSANLATLGAAAGVPLRLAGVATGLARLTMSEGHPVAVDGEIDVERLGVDRMRLGTLHSRFRADEVALKLSDATWSIGDTIVRGGADARLVEGAPFEIDAQGERLSAYRLFSALGLSPRPWVDARVAGRIRGSGTLAPFVLDGTGKGTVADLIVASKDARTATSKERVITVARPVQADLIIHADPAGLVFKGDVDDGLSQAKGSCRLWFDPERGMLLEATSEHAALETLGDRVATLQVSGHGSGSLRIEGPYEKVVISADAKATNLRVMGFLLGHAYGSVHASPPLLSFRDVVVTKEKSTYTGTLSLDFTEDPRRRKPYLVLDVALTDAQAEDLRAVIPRSARDPGLVTLRELDLRGPVGGSFHAEGPAGEERPERMRGDGLVIGKRGARLWGQNVEGGHVRFHFNRGQMIVDNIGVNLARAR